MAWAYVIFSGPSWLRAVPLLDELDLGIHPDDTYSLAGADTELHCSPHTAPEAVPVPKRYSDYLELQTENCILLIHLFIYTDLQ
uniref:Uncharacterized protein n=1 Tax=Knipowitschia caucasica TaxID=637954 RepID=A0AAV2MS59_KNICA